MVGGTTQQQQQAHQLAPPSSTSSSTAPMTSPEEDELLKRNTDCVYFLASPLTCKKGSECEYRHSDIARVNPRDCWYWLNGNCLNPKCAFRHPPLDGLLGAEVSTPTGPSVPAPHASSYGMPKQGVACIFFQKGFCLKGHLCPFLHGPPNSVNNKTTQSGPANPVTEPPKTASSNHDKSIQEQKIAQHATVQKPVEFQLPQGKQASRTQPTLPARNSGNGAIDKKAPLPSNMAVEDPPRYKPARVVPPPVMNETRGGKPDRGVHHAYHVSENDRVMNGKDANEYSRDPSPGFDVLVDNKHGDSEYYHDKDEFGRSRGASDYDVDRDVYHEQRDYDSYNEPDGHYAWDDRRASSERMLIGSAHLERRPHPRSDSPDHFNESDLRHRISKQRRGSDNGSRSYASRDYGRENHADRVPRRDNALSSRLRGRIKIPGRSMSPPNENNSRTEREIDIGRRHQSRYSPGRPMSLNQSRLRDRIKGRVSEDRNIDMKDYKGSRGHRDLMYENDTEFAGPKRLSELKSGRSSESHEQHPGDGQVLGKRKNPRAESRQFEDDLSFEGPKPLSEILKRKRGVDNHFSSVNNSKETETIPANMVSTNKEEQKYAFGDTEPEKQTGSSNLDKEESTDGKSSFNYDENEGGLMDEDALLDEELEAYDHREGDYDYEQIDGEEDYKLDEGEYVEEEYGEEYGKKDDVVYE